MSSPFRRNQKMPEILIRSLGCASYCWEQQLRKTQARQATNTNLCTLPVGGHAPIGVNLFAPEDLGIKIEQSPFSSRHLIDGLLREIEQVASISLQRKVPWLNWCLPQSLLDSSEVTEIMYYLGRQFHLGESNSDI